MSIELVIIIPIMLALMMVCVVLIQFVTEWASFELDTSDVFLKEILLVPIKSTFIQIEDVGIWQTLHYDAHYKWESRFRNVIDQEILLNSRMERKVHSRGWVSFVKNTADEILLDDKQ